jgi:hypothetical protein
LAVVLRDQRRLFGAELDARHVGETHDRAASLRDDERLEVLLGAEVRVGEQVDLHQVALRLADGGEEVVAPQRRVDVSGSEV